MDAQLRLEHDSVRSAKRKMIVVQKKINSTKRDGQHLMPERPIPLYNPRPPMRGFASLKGNTLPVKNVINGLHHVRIFICK